MIYANTKAIGNKSHAHYPTTKATNKTGYKFRLDRSQLPSVKPYFDQHFNTSKEQVRNGWFNCLCPFHKDTTPSLRVNVERGGYRCMACSAHGGDLIAFVMQWQGLQFIEACKYLGAWSE